MAEGVRRAPVSEMPRQGPVLTVTEGRYEISAGKAVPPRVGSISEIADAEAPFSPRGCVAQAWSVAEVLRAWVKTADHP